MAADAGCAGVGLRIAIAGTVQGVGFRPFVYRVALDHGVTGRVWNHAAGVTIEAFGSGDSLSAFVADLRAKVPPAAHIEKLVSTAIPFHVLPGFAIEHSEGAGGKAVSIPADLATCPECQAEVADPNERRHGYAFTNCTACGPRFSIATGIPYDRPQTTMAEFPLCADCRREYTDPLDRRFHAQPIACPVCGPRLWLVDTATGETVEGAALDEAARRLTLGQIVAIKGIGGFHLACDATSTQAVDRLRARKHREEKPFAVMVDGVERAEELASLTDPERVLLASAARPIVLVRGRVPTPLSPSVAPGSDVVGIFLPYTPLHHLLLAKVARPLVMTSGNVSDEPIAFRNEDAQVRLKDIADAILFHDRPIANPCDDSVTRVMDGNPLIMRRSRGYVPMPIRLAVPVPMPLLACGAQLKNTFCLAAGDTAFLGPHIGDLDNAATLAAFEEAVARLSLFTGIVPEVVAHDAHPDYLSTRYAMARSEPRKVAVWHHHAHVVSAMAEHGISGKVVGVAFDGTGLGPDGTAWGGEILECTQSGFVRRGTLRPIRLAGGDRAMREVWRLALAVLDDAYDGRAPLDGLALFSQVDEGRIAGVRSLISAGLNSPFAHGAGRYFDAMGALILGRPEARFEGQVAMAVDAVAVEDDGVYPYAIVPGDVAQIDLRAMVRAVVADLIDGVLPGVVSARFHHTLSMATADMVLHGTDSSLPVVLTGGCFQNGRLTSSLVARLRVGRKTLVHGQIPCGDGGLALGQAVAAAAMVTI